MSRKMSEKTALLNREDITKKNDPENIIRPLKLTKFIFLLAGVFILMLIGVIVCIFLEKYDVGIILMIGMKIIGLMTLISYFVHKYNAKLYKKINLKEKNY